MSERDDDFREPHLRQADFLGAFAVMQSAAGTLMVQNRRHIGGRSVLTWDRPGGQVEPGETLLAALRRELAEEIGVTLETEVDPEFLFVQEGIRTVSSAPVFAWRSFFFRVETWVGTPVAQSEVLDSRWMDDATMGAELTAPYHDSFLAWRRSGGTFFSSRWSD
jgi:8-oxo-dGTP pyrophosphatase MutT (NUDIX family)